MFTRVMRTAWWALLVVACDQRQRDQSAPLLLRADDPVPILSFSEHDGAPFEFSSDFAADRRVLDGNLHLVEMMHDGTVRISDDNRVLAATDANVIHRSFGRFGAGPGEFAYINAMCRTVGDSIVVLDGAGRYTVLDSALKTVRHFRAERSATISAQEGCLLDGALLALVLRDRDSSDVFRLSTQGVLEQRVATVPNDANSLASAELTISAAPDGMLIANPLDGLIVKSDLHGKHLSRYRLTRLTSAQQRAGQIPQMSRGTAFGEREQKRSHAPSPMRYFQGVVLGGDGRLWVRDVPTPEQTHDSWTAFDVRSGKTLLRLHLSLQNMWNSSPRVLKITSDRVIFSHLDSLGQPTLRTVDIPKQ